MMDTTRTRVAVAAAVMEDSDEGCGAIVLPGQLQQGPVS